uniref:SusC/RagA family TonB-linked outer membrane protein n=1 Tax=Winogradskyella sp. TaxID=1883156 RepID=UPI003AB5EEA2
MNKNENLYALRSVKSLRYNLVNIMRVFLLLITIGLSSAFANTTIAQTKIDVNVKNVTLEELFRDIQSKSEFIFFYKDNVLKYNVTLNVKNASVTTILDSALKGTNLTYKVNDRQIVVKENLSSLDQGRHIKTNQQEKTITGKVLDDTGNPLMGATVQVKGTNIGVATDFDGHFSLTVSENTTTIVISYLGFATQEIDITDKTTVEVKMIADSAALDEIVIIGYGSEQKSLLSDAVSSIKSSSVKDLPIPSVDGLLQGQAAGVQVQQNSGTPGGEMSVRIRGLSSISGSNQPLYIIDGIPVTSGDFGRIGYSGQGASALSDLNPSDIESISVLKDASATAIYGARGSNGIVLITTKRGKEQKSVVSVNVYSGVQQAWNKLDMLNAREWMEYRNDLAGTTVFTPEDIANNTIDTDWQDVIFRTASINSYEASARGGSEKTQYFISGTYLEQEGILIGTDYQRVNARVNVDHQLSDKVKIGTSIGLTHAKTNRVESDQTL